MEYGIYGAVATVALGVIVHAVRATWALSRVEKELRNYSAALEKDLREYLAAQIDNVSRDVVNLERTGMERAETLRHEFGETGASLRTKIHEVETWNRDTFVRKDSFEQVVGRIEKSMEKLGDRLEEKLDKLDERIQQH